MIAAFGYYMFANVLEDAKAGNERMEQEAIDLYRKALQMPRKKKKRMKKEALLQYSIAQCGKQSFQF